MGNLVAVLTHTSRGNAVILDRNPISSITRPEEPALLADTVLAGREPAFSRRPANFKSALRPDNIHFAPAKLLCLENTHNRRGGTVLKPEEQAALYESAREAGLSVHLDGARIFNAAIALNCPVTALTRSCDSVMFSLSKGLGAPAGSILAGSASFIQLARRYRKILGGGMRQSGILAAAGLIALKHIPYLAADHRRALRLAEGLNRLPGLKISPFPPPTNIIIIDIEDTDCLRGVSLHSPVLWRESRLLGVNLVRMVTTGI